MAAFASPSSHGDGAADGGGAFPLSASAAAAPSAPAAPESTGFAADLLAKAKSLGASAAAGAAVGAAWLDKRIPHIRGRPALTELYANLKPGITVALVSL
jgi:hypothetical protein